MIAHIPFRIYVSIEHLAPFPRRNEIRADYTAFLPNFEVFGFFHAFYAAESSALDNRKRGTVKVREFDRSMLLC